MSSDFTPPLDPGPTKLAYPLAGGGAQREIANFADAVEANIVAMVLESQGVRAKVIQTAPRGAMSPHGGTLVVREADAPRAIELLASTPARKRLTVPESELPPAKVIKIDVCPQCESTEVKPGRIAGWIALMILVPAWLPFTMNYGWALYFGIVAGGLALLMQLQGWRCTACGHRWRKGTNAE
jgi:hypothetical protein